MWIDNQITSYELERHLGRGKYTAYLTTFWEHPIMFIARGLTRVALFLGVYFAVLYALMMRAS